MRNAIETIGIEKGLKFLQFEKFQLQIADNTGLISADRSN